jgi:hypothetical protein
MKMARLAILAFFISISGAFALDWVGSQTHAGIAYFFVSSPARVDRYHLANRQWLAPIILPGARGALTTAAVDADGLYVAYDTSIYRYSLTGTNEQFLVTSSTLVRSLHTDGNLLLVNHSSFLFARLISVDKSNNQVITTFSQNTPSAPMGTSSAPTLNKLFGCRPFSSNNFEEVVSVSYNDDGTFVGATDSPYNANFPTATKTWVFPNEDRFVDNVGVVYSTADMTYVKSFDSDISDLCFSGTDIPILLSGNRLTVYTTALLPAGSTQLDVTPKTIYVQGTDVLAFIPTGTSAINVLVVPLSNLQPPAAVEPVDPNGLAYTPDASFVGQDGVVYLLSKTHQNIFRWDSATQAYLSSIPLTATPDFAAYSPSQHAIYLALPSGLINRISLNVSFQETPLAILTSAPQGLSAAGDYLFACDHTDVFSLSHYTFDSTGALVSRVNGHSALSEFTWSETNQKMYFFRSNHLQSEEINANGTTYPSLAAGAIGLTQDSSNYSSFQNPVRVAPDGSIVVLGSGFLHNALTLERLAPALTNTITDAAWLNGALCSTRTLSGFTQYQRWSQVNYGLALAKSYPGTAHRLMSLSTTALFGASIPADGIPSFYVLDQNFDVVAPPSLAKPRALEATLVNGNWVDLVWQDSSGETDYRIERQTLPDGPWEEVGTSSTSVTAWSDFTSALGNTYAYRVVAIHGELASEPSDAVTITTWSLLEDWRFQNYGTIADSGNAANLADNGTGVSNLLRFAFNLSAAESPIVVQETTGTKGLPLIRPALDDSRLEIVFIRRRAEGNPGIQYIPEFSSDLQTWSTAGFEVSATDINDNFEYVVWKDNAAASSKRFGRLRIVTE